VFGEVVGEDSMEVVRKIEASKTDGRDKPENEVRATPSVGDRKGQSRWGVWTRSRFRREGDV